MKPLVILSVVTLLVTAPAAFAGRDLSELVLQEQLRTRLAAERAAERSERLALQARLRECQARAPKE